MEYTYLLENRGDKNLEFDDIKNKNGICILNILCYHIDVEHKYPFLQFMMDNHPHYCNNIVNEQLTIPYIILRNSLTLIKDVLERVKSGLNIIDCDFNKVTNDMYKGIVFINDMTCALVNITGIDIYGLNLTRQTTTWFVLPSEIINTKKVFNIEVNSEVVNLFTDIPTLTLLNKPNTDEFYMLPDVVYTGSEIKKAEFYSIFGNCKTKVYNSCGEYYFFYRTFGDAVRDGGRITSDKLNEIGEKQLVEDNNRYITYGTNRYALFFEGKIHLTSDSEISLTDDMIENLYPEPCIIICYLGEHKIKPDMLVKNYESFVCLSYHTLNKKLDEYMIA